MKQGQELVCIGCVGTAGTRIIIENKRAELEKRFSRAYLDAVAMQAAANLSLSDFFEAEQAAAETDADGFSALRIQTAAALQRADAAEHTSGVSCSVQQATEAVGEAETFSADAADIRTACTSGAEPLLIQTEEKPQAEQGQQEQLEQVCAALRITSLQSVGKGGVLAALWNLCSRYNAGCEFWMDQFPAVQGTIELCEFYDLLPYRLYAENCWLAVTDNGGALVRRLRAAGYAAAVTGIVTKGKKRVRTDGEEPAFLTKEQRDELEKLFGKMKRHSGAGL